MLKGRGDGLKAYLITAAAFNEQSNKRFFFFFYKTLTPFCEFICSPIVCFISKKKQNTTPNMQPSSISHQIVYFMFKELHFE